MVLQQYSNKRNLSSPSQMCDSCCDVVLRLSRLHIYVLGPAEKAAHGHAAVTSSISRGGGREGGKVLTHEDGGRIGSTHKARPLADRGNKDLDSQDLEQ